MTNQRAGENSAPSGGERGDPDVLLRLAEARMPYGRHKGKRLLDLPEPYVIWLARQGFPRGQLGELLGLVHEIKVNGLESLLTPLRRRLL